MSYINRHHGLGGLADVASAAINVVRDPCLTDVALLVNQLHALEQRSPTGLGDDVPGIGLCSAITPLRIAVAIKKRPWVIPVGGVAIVAGLVGLGYVIGKGRRR